MAPGRPMGGRFLTHREFVWDAGPWRSRGRVQRWLRPEGALGLPQDWEGNRFVLCMGMWSADVVFLGPMTRSTDVGMTAGCSRETIKAEIWGCRGRRVSS